MARQSLIWTTLPNGMTAEGQPRVSLLVSPRLDPQADPQELSTFAEWLDWPGALAGATFTVHYGNDSVSIAATDLAGPARVDDRLGTADSAVWKLLFSPGLYVRPFVFEDLAGHEVTSFDAAGMSEMIDTLYGNLAGGSEMPSISGILADPDWQELVATVKALDRGNADEDTGLPDPRRLLERNVTRSTSVMQRRLAEFQAFQVPPSQPKVVHHTRSDDPRISTTYAGFEYEREDDAAREKRVREAVAAIDFHQVVSAMNQYPVLLRRLGLVVDLLLPAGAFTGSQDNALFTQVSFGRNGLPTPTAPRAALVTHAKLARNSFQAVPDPVPDPEVFEVTDGLVNLDDKKFALLQLDVDAGGSKLMGFARSLSQLAQGERRYDPVSRQEKTTGAPALNNAGLMLVHRKRGAALKRRFLDNAAKAQTVQAVFQSPVGNPPPPAPELYAEDLVRGFRFDIWDDKTSLWRSLFQRSSAYFLASDTPDGATIEVEAEEGTARLAATRAVVPTVYPKRLWLHEAIVSWTGWSLAVPPPGRTVLPDDSVDTTSDETQAEVPEGIPLRTRFSVLPGSLPRLRFGRGYWMRARVVDLAGNSLPPQAEDFGPEHPEDHKRTYLRYEPLAAPVLALHEDAAANIDVPEDGESMAVMAIRSFNDTPADNSVPTADECRRVAVPPQSSVRDAEQHGLLDAAGRVDKSTFALLASQDKDAKQADAAPREVLIPQQGPMDDVAVDTVFAVYADGHALTYLPDPLAREVAVRVFGHPHLVDTNVLTIPLYRGGQWPAAVPFTIRVLEDGATAPFYDEEGHVLNVPLPKGVRVKVRLSMKMPESALAHQGAWAWLTDAQKSALKQTIGNGQHWMFTPWRTVDVLHAVQRPLIAPEILAHEIDRGFGATHARPRIVARVSLKSTDKLDLLAVWHEPVDDPRQAGAEEIAANKTRGDRAYTVKITPPNEYASQLGGATGGGVPDHTVLAEDGIGVGLPSFDQSPGKPHEFYDTRYRRIEYHLEATSRFREFMPKSLLTDGGTEAVDDNIKVVGPTLVTWIPNSAPPSPPEVLYVLPTFGWARTEDRQGNERRWRRGGGIRVYLDRPWMATGYGEMLAVILPPAGFSGDPDSEPASYPYKKYITQWGNDPIWQSAYVSGLAPKRGDFPASRLAADPTGAWLPANAPDAEKDQPADAFEVTGLRPPDVPFGNAPIEIAPHDVRYDAERRLWYCDIEIDQGRAYYPFIRLALARYQPVSVSGAHLSNVVLADFMPLTADRWLNVNQTNTRNRRRVTVHGNVYFGSSGAQEADQAPRMSIFNVLTGEARTLKPAAVAPRTVVEVWVEKLDPDEGEDFGWHRSSDAIVTSDQDAPTVGPLQVFVPVSQRMRAIELHKARKFETILAENLAEKLYYVAPLWSGHVTLTGDSDNRYRLVVAEYEEYLVDDTRPYDPVPESKGRRLVFVEHVELVATTG